jgi:hypothetical protein
MQGKVEHVPRLPKGINTTSYALQDGYPFRSIHHKLAKLRSKHQRETTTAVSLRSCLGDGLGHRSLHGHPAWLCHGGVLELVEVINGMYLVVVTKKHLLCE